LTQTMVDHLGRVIEFHFPPKRVISLCPAITETLFSLQVRPVGRTKYCIFPKGEVDTVSIVGGTKEIELRKIQELKPDLIIAEKEENTKEMVETLEQEFPVFVAEVQSIQDAYRMIEDLGKITQRTAQANKLVSTIQKEFQSLPKLHGKRMAYVIWRKPYMVVGNDTYINSLLESMGFINPAIELQGRYPAVTKEQLQEMDLDVILLATEPFPFTEKHKEEFRQFLPKTQPVLVDGEMFWYGAKMIEAATYFRQFLFL
jgi:iron complex transport system substrate-binding protein